MSTAIKITYYGEPEEDFTISEFDGLSDFKKDLDKNYVTLIHQKTDGYGAGFYELTVEILSNINLKRFIELLGSGIAFDIIKSTTKDVILKPFINAYKKLKKNNKDIDIEELKFSFKDSSITVHKIYQNSIFEELEGILLGLSINYTNLYLKSGEKPYQIEIPIFKYPDKSYGVKYRSHLSVDEPLQNLDRNSYYKFWGAYYQFRGWYFVFNYREQEVTDFNYYTEKLYLDEVKRKDS